MKFEEQLLTRFRQHFVYDLDNSPDDFFSTYRFLDWERDIASRSRDLHYQAQIYTLLGMLEDYRKKPDHSLKYYQLAHDIFERGGDDEATAYTAHKINGLAAPV